MREAGAVAHRRHRSPRAEPGSACCKHQPRGQKLALPAQAPGHETKKRHIDESSSTRRNVLPVPSLSAARPGISTVVLSSEGIHMPTQASRSFSVKSLGSHKIKLHSTSQSCLVFRRLEPSVFSPPPLRNARVGSLSHFGRLKCNS
jgi:hypothetical protein